MLDSGNLQQFEDEQQQQQQNNNNNSHQQEQKSCTKVVVTIQRKSQLCLFVFALISFIVMDEFSLLPICALLYTAVLSLAWENWLEELENERIFVQHLTIQRNKRNTLQLELEKARFEYHILKKKPYINIKVAINKKYDTGWVVYAEERRTQRQ